MVRVKICGITNVVDARGAASLGADALGFNFVPTSARCITPEMAKAIVLAMPPFVTPVAVFADADVHEIEGICAMCGINWIQLHGHETPAYVEKLHRFRCIKAIRVEEEDDLRQLSRYTVDAFLLDTKVRGELGGTGQSFDWRIAASARAQGTIIIAGGLRPDNVAEAVRKVRPYAVDVASGVEIEPGLKDRSLVAEFIIAAKSALAH
jgi:phosphoribosylanthranilate isomerase